MEGAFRDGGSCAVQLGLLRGLDLHIDAGHAVVEVDEVGLEALRGQTTFQPCACLAGNEAQRDACTVQLFQDTRNIDALSAQNAVLSGGAVHFADFQRGVQADNIVDGGIERYSVDHASVSFIRVNCRYLGLGQRLVRIAPPCRSAMTAG